MTDNRELHHCACRFKDISGPPALYCSHHARVRDALEAANKRIALEEKYSEELLSKGAELEAEIERLKQVRI